MLAKTGFEIDGATNLTNRSTQPAGATVREVSVTRDEIESGKVFFAALPDAVGRNAELEFNVSDGALKSTIPGLFTVSVQGAPKSLDDSIKDAQFTRSFEAEIGEGRFKSIDVALTSAGLTRDEALREIRGLQEDRNDLKESTLATTHSKYSANDILYKISNLEEVDFRWEIGWLSHSNSQNVRTDISQLTSNAFLNISSFSDDDLATVIAAKFTTTAKLSFKGDITPAFESSNADDIYEALTFNGGPLYVRSPEIDS